MGKKLLGLFCVLVMLVTMLPTNVMAADGELQVYVGVNYVDEEGEYRSTSIMYKVTSGITKGEAFAQANEQLSQIEHGGKYEFTSWEGLLTEEEKVQVLTGTLSKNAYAHYEKYDIEVDAVYLNKQGKKETSTLTITVDDGATVKDVYDAIVLENEKENRIGWVATDDVEETIGVMDLAYGLHGAAVYDDMMPVNLWADYISKHDAMGPSAIIQFMQFYAASDATDEELEAAAIEYFKNTDEKEEAWDGLETIIDYKGIVERTKETHEVDGFYYADDVTLGVTYDKVPMYLEYPDGEEEWVLIKNGEKYTFPEEYKGYALTWNYRSSVNEISDLETVKETGVTEVTIIEGMYFYYAHAVQGDKLSEYVELDGESPSISSEEMAQIMASDMEVIIDTKKNVIFHFAAGTMQAVEGKTEYDFGVELIETPTAELLEKAPFEEEEFVLRINYNYSGNLPGEAEITIFVGEEYAGQTLYYYLVKDNGELEYTNTKAIVNTNGEYIIKQSHCSDYVIATVEPSEENPDDDSQNPGGETTTPGGETTTPGGETTTPGGETTTPGGETTTPGGEDSDKDKIEGMGDATVTLYIGMILLGFALVVVAKNRKTV